MKNLSAFLATALLAMLSFSCSSKDDDDPGTPATPAIGDQLYNYDTNKPYTGSGKVYMMEDRSGNNGRPILTEDNMLLVGTVNNGKINLDFPQNVPSHFLFSFADVPEDSPPMPAGFNVEPLSVKVWIYVNPLYLVGNNGELIGFIDLLKDGEEQAHRLSYWYFSEKASIHGFLEGQFDIDAERGWNKIYWDMDKTSESMRMTTDLSNVPEGLMWLLFEY